MKSKHIMSILTLIILFISTHHLNAQEIDIKLSNTYFIDKVNIVQKPGEMIEMGAIIIKDGLIAEVGKNLNAPPEAITIKADSMFIYPGFIDAFNTIGVKKSDDETPAGRGQRGGNPGVSDPGNPPNDKAGITPERNLSSVWDNKAKSIKQWREAGFTASLSAPEGGMLPGKAAIVLHSGKDADGSILKNDIGVVGTFQNARRMYPATVIGVMARYRDLLRNAELANKHNMAYKENPVGMARPSYDASTMALIPVSNKDLPLFFKAEKLKDISRAMALQDDLGFDLCLMNVKQVGPFLDEIKSNEIPVNLSLDIPKSEAKKDEKDTDEKDKKEKNAEIEALEKRKQESIKEYQSQAAMMSKDGVEFTFSGLSAKPKDVKGNLNAMVEQGLSQEEALAALTIVPAERYGLLNVMGTVEKGKMANIFISNKNYFDKDSKIKDVFVDGHHFEYEIKENKKKKEKGDKEADGESSVDIVGTYSYTVDVPGDEQKGKLTINKDGDGYNGTLNIDGEELEIDEINLDGNRITFPMEIENDGFTMEIEFDFKLDGDDIEGSVSAGQFGSFPLTGEKLSSPK